MLPVAKTLLKPGGSAVALIKPQFEAGREKIGKKGVVRDPAVHFEVISHIFDFIQNVGLTPLGLTFSPIKGPEGNIEYLLYLCNSVGEQGITEASAEEVVREAHACLNG